MGVDKNHTTLLNVSANNYSEYSDNTHLNDIKDSVLYSDATDTPATQTVSTEISPNTINKNSNYLLTSKALMLYLFTIKMYVV
jgi:hypothetical protein